MTTAPITLYCDGYFVNQWDGACMVALAEKGLVYSTARALLRDGQGVPPALHQLTAIARVPALQHGDMWLTESSAIIEYLDEAFPPPDYPRLMPEEPRRRARARQVMAWVRGDLQELRDEREYWTTLYPAPPPRPLSRVGLKLAGELVVLATRLLDWGELDGFSCMHVDLALTLRRLTPLDPALPDSVVAFVERTCSRPSVQAYLHHPRPPNPPPLTASRG